MKNVWKSSKALIGTALAAGLSACVATAPSGNGSPSESEMLSVGQQAPRFEVPDEDGNLVRLEDHLGQNNIVLIFYPGNDTPGCTKQLCTARDDFGQYQKLDAVVYGVNPAAADSHTKFAEKYSFPFPLLADTDGKMIRDYGCRGMGGITIRTVYAIGKDGKIVFAQRGMPSTDTILASLEG